jgi:hypothetical protein
MKLITEKEVETWKDYAEERIDNATIPSFDDDLVKMVSMLMEEVRNLQIEVGKLTYKPGESLKFENGKIICLICGNPAAKHPFLRFRAMSVGQPPAKVYDCCGIEVTLD